MLIRRKLVRHRNHLTVEDEDQDQDVHQSPKTAQATKYATAGRKSAKPAAIIGLALPHRETFPAQNFRDEISNPHQKRPGAISTNNQPRENISGEKCRWWTCRASILGPPPPRAAPAPLLADFPARHHRTTTAAASTTTKPPCYLLQQSAWPGGYALTPAWRR